VNRPHRKGPRFGAPSRKREAAGISSTTKKKKRKGSGEGGGGRMQRMASKEPTSDEKKKGEGRNLILTDLKRGRAVSIQKGLKYRKGEKGDPLREGRRGGRFSSPMK